MINVRINTKGFTLIEIIFAIAIFGIISLSIYTMITTTLTIYKNSELQYKATLLALGYLETMEASYTLDIGQTTYEEGEYTIEIDVSKAEKYNGKLYKIVIEVASDDDILERIEGYKVKPMREWYYEEEPQ